MNILIIEDDQMLRRAIGHTLTETGHSVSNAANGQEAIENIEKNKDVDLIICDVLMPVLTGPTFLLMLKRYYPHGLPPILIISGVKEGEEFLKKIEIKYDHFLPKPLNFDRLAQVVNDVATVKK